MCRIIPERLADEFDAIKIGPRSASMNALLLSPHLETYFFIIRRGWAAAYLALPDGRMQILDVLLPGDAAPLHRVFVAGKGPLVKAVTPVEYCAMNSHEFKAFLERHRDIMGHVFDLVGTLFKKRDVAILQLGALDARQALLALLHALIDRYRQGAGAEAKPVFPLRSRLLAEALGITVVHAGRILKDLEREELILRVKGGVRIVNEDRLRQKAAALLPSGWSP
ncbi:MAG: Crp/Fnr family transcriptional regulator [Pseudomonadota bacterium]